MEEEGDETVSMNRVSKRSRYNKNMVVMFDNADRTEYLSGFRKRKEKRRQAAEQQKVYKERQKRLQDRRERRAALKVAKGGTEVGTQGSQNGAEDEEDEAAEKDKDVGGTLTYEDRETMTVVRLTPITGEEEEYDETAQTVSHLGTISKGKCCATKPNKIKPGKVQFKKQKKVQSEKRMRKLTRREKSVPKNLRSRRDKRRKK